MAQLLAIGTAVPPYQMEQSEVKAFSKAHFARSYDNIDRLLTLFDHTGIQQRNFSQPRTWFEEDHTLTEKNDAYIETACQLGEEAIRQCLAQTEFTASQIDHLIFVSTTGVATPSIDAQLINRLRMNPHIKRTPIWGLGCAGGVVGLSRAYEAAMSSPKSCVLLVAVECCSLTFRSEDLSKSNLVATSLFADGAAAALIVGEECERRDQHPGSGPEMVEAMSTLFSDSLDVMGWQLQDDGLKVIFSKEIPVLVQQRIKPLVETFLKRSGLTLSDLETYITHPGGFKVLQAYQSALSLSETSFTHSYQVLRQYGNMSSVTVLFVLKEELAESHQLGSYSLVSALGPGFSAEMLLLRWGRQTASMSPQSAKGTEAHV